MILNEHNNGCYKLILDINDLNSLNINVHSFLGNSSNINIHIKDILNKLNIKNLDDVYNIEIISFSFKIFRINFCAKKKLIICNNSSQNY